MIPSIESMQRDPYERVRGRIENKLMRYANPFGFSQTRVPQPEPYSLNDDQRQGWLNTIADGTMGSLAKFGNFLDVPGSSMREVLKGVTGGGWSNPFDQWAPWNWTNDKGRVSGRDLGRQWGWMSKKDTWGNLFGGIGIEIATDPLLLLGFGGGAVSKGGRFAKLSGLDKYMPQLLDSTNAARIAKEGEKATQVGMNELWRSATVKDLLGAAGPADELGDALRIAARTKADSAAKRFGYNSLDEALAEFGDQPLRGIARYGLPNLKMFGASNAEKLKGAPEILMGLGESGRKYGKAWDAVTGPLGRSFPAVMAKQALESASQGFGQYWTQAKARAGWEMKEAGEVAAKQGIGEAQALVDTVIPKELRPSSTNFEQAVKDNHEYRKLFEDYAQGTPAQRAVVEKVWKHVDEAFNEARRWGAKVDPLDDMYTKHFPRSLSAFLKKSESDAFKEVVRKFPTNSPVHAWNENMLARHPVLKDIKGGTEAFDRIVQDPVVHKILDNDKIKTGKRLYQLSRYLEKKYGPKGQNIFAWGERGEKIRGTEISDITDAASEMLAGEYKTKQVTAVQGAKEIMEDAALSDSDKAIKIQMMLDDMDLKAEFGKDLSKGLTMQDRLWMVKNSRYMETASFLDKISPEARKFGIFGNWPLYDAENYSMRMRDSAAKARTALDILGDERAYSTSVSGAPISKVFRALNLDEEVVVPILAKRLGLKPENILGRVVNSETAKDLINFSTMFDGPEPSKWLGRVLDSFMSAFKANVTAPFPSFHARNFLSGQFRNVIAGNFSFKSLNDSMRMLFGKDIEGIEKLPVIRTRYERLRAEMPALGLPEKLDNVMANKLLRYMVRENGVVGKYGRDFPLEVMNQSAGAPTHGGSAMSGMAQDLRAAAPGENPFSMRYMGEEYIGLPHNWEVEGKKARSPRTTTMGGPWLPVNPFAIPEKMIGKAALKSGLAKPGGRMERWANKKLIEVPSVFKTPGVYEDMGLTKAGREQIGAFVREGGKETTQRNLMWGPVAGGMHAGHAVEFPNRVGSWLKQIYDGVDPEEAARIVSDTQISYKPKHYTPLESQVLKRLFPFYSFCVPDTYEILTRDGWKTHDQLIIGEEVLTLNHANGTMEWQPIQDVNTFDYDGELLVHSHKKRTRVIEWAFTPHHSWPVLEPSGREHASRGGVACIHYKTRRVMKHGFDLTEGDCVPSSGEYHGTDTCLSPRHAALLGWIVTDGYFRTKFIKGRAYQEAVIYQSPNKHLAKIVELTGSNPRKPHPQTGVVAVNVKKSDLNVICEFFSSKRDLVKIVGNLSRESAEAMWQAMFDAEGSTSDKGNMHFAQYDDDVSDAFQMLCFLTGRSAHRSQSGCYIRKSTGHYIGRNLSRRQYTGKVWCPTVENGTWVMRNNGAAIITGNTSRSLPWTIRKFIEKPGNMLSQTIRGTQRTAQHMRNQFHHPGPMPDYLGDTLAIPVEAQEPGAKRYLTGMDLMEQDIWQLGGPALSGDLASLGFEIAGRAAPLWGKLPIEMITGTSLWQRGVEGGRPLRNLDPLVGRTYANTMQQLARVMGEEIPPEKIREMVGETGTFEKVVANSPYSRYLSSWRTLMDPRKGLGAKATNLLTGSKFQDVSLPAQETLLREHIRNMIAKEGGTIFEKATFPSALMEYWRKNDPEKFIKAMQLKALSDERTKVAKKMQEFTKRGLPAGMAIQQ